MLVPAASIMAKVFLRVGKCSVTVLVIHDQLSAYADKRVSSGLVNLALVDVVQTVATAIMVMTLN